MKEGERGSRSALGLVIRKRMLGGPKPPHDIAKRKKTEAKIASRIQLKFFKSKGDDYIKAWYLHHALDYLNDNKSKIKSEDEDMEGLFLEYKCGRHMTYSEEIIDFLRDNIKDLEEDLGL